MPGFLSPAVAADDYADGLVAVVFVVVVVAAAAAAANAAFF